MVLLIAFILCTNEVWAQINVGQRSLEIGVAGAFKDIFFDLNGDLMATCGGFTPNSPLGSDFVVKMSSDGTVQWVRGLDDPQLHDFRRVVQLPDSSYIVTGELQANNQIVMLRLDQNGALLGRKTLTSGQTSMTVSNLEVLPSGGFATGLSYNNAFALSVYDPNLNMIALRGFFDPTQLMGNALIKGTDDGGFLAVTSVTAATTDVDVGLIKLDSNFNVEWTIQVGDPYIDQAFDAVVLPDGYLIGGYSSYSNPAVYRGMLMKVSRSGTLLWRRFYSGGRLDFRRIAVVGPDRYALGGFGRFNGGNKATMIVTDSLGNVLGQRYFLPAGRTYSTIWSLISDGQTIYAVGSETIPGQRGYLMMTDTMGQSGCDEVLTSYTMTSPAPMTVRSFTVQPMTPSIGAVNTPGTMYDPPFAETVHCQTVLAADDWGLEARFDPSFGVLLSWTQTDQSETYEVTRSTDGVGFDGLGVVHKMDQYVDPDPAVGWNFYQVRATDPDGQVSRSQVGRVWVEDRGDEGVAFWPNPATDQIRIKGPSGSCVIEVADLSGWVIERFEGVLDGQRVVRLDRLEPGVYLISLEAEGRRTVRRFCKL